MLLNSIIIDNIRSYEHEEVEFPRGISLFEGDIGSGKSTVLMAIEFALFGLGSQKAESLLAKKLLQELGQGQLVNEKKNEYIPRVRDSVLAILGVNKDDSQ